MKSIIIETGYKVVHVDKDNKLCSGWYIPPKSESASTRYHINRWTKPKKGNGPLCIFTSFEDAREFTSCSQGSFGWVNNYERNLAIYKCLYVPCNETKLWYQLSGGFKVIENNVSSVFTVNGLLVLSNRVKLIECIDFQ